MKRRDPHLCIIAGVWSEKSLKFIALCKCNKIFKFYKINFHINFIKHIHFIAQYTQISEAQNAVNLWVEIKVELVDR